MNPIFALKLKADKETEATREPITMEDIAGQVVDIISGCLDDKFGRHYCCNVPGELSRKVDCTVYSHVPNLIRCINKNLKNSDVDAINCLQVTARRYANVVGNLITEFKITNANGSYDKWLLTVEEAMDMLPDKNKLEFYTDREEWEERFEHLNKVFIDLSDIDKHIVNFFKAIRFDNDSGNINSTVMDVYAGNIARNYKIAKERITSSIINSKTIEIADTSSDLSMDRMEFTININGNERATLATVLIKRNGNKVELECYKHF